jgi:toxin ParE1/3/4
MGPRIEGRVRSMSILDFPYKIIYAQSDDVLLIIAVAHHRRQPGYWRDRLPTG